MCRVHMQLPEFMSSAVLQMLAASVLAYRCCAGSSCC
jgi:hypothetical protein